MGQCAGRVKRAQARSDSSARGSAPNRMTSGRNSSASFCAPPLSPMRHSYPLPARYSATNSFSSASRLGASINATTSALSESMRPASLPAASSVSPNSPSRTNCDLKAACSASAENQLFIHSPLTDAMVMSVMGFLTSSMSAVDG